MQDLIRILAWQWQRNETVRVISFNKMSEPGNMHNSFRLSGCGYQGIDWGGGAGGVLSVSR